MCSVSLLPPKGAADRPGFFRLSRVVFRMTDAEIQRQFNPSETRPVDRAQRLPRPGTAEASKMPTPLRMEMARWLLSRQRILLLNLAGRPPAA